MTDTSAEELHRVGHGPPEGATPGGIGWTFAFLVTAPPGRAAEVLERARAVMGAFLTTPAGAAYHELPDWFLARCAGEPGDPVADAVYGLEWRSLPVEERAAAEREQPWAASDWLAWMIGLDGEPRAWRWWDARVVDDGRALVFTEADGWPFPWGALRWLLVAAGATDVCPEWEDTWAEEMGVL